ncbi:MAG: peptidase S10 [Acidobacteriaceae bacterium]
MIRHVGCCTLAALLALPVALAQKPNHDGTDMKAADHAADEAAPRSPGAMPPDSITEGSVTTVDGQAIQYKAIAGMLTVGSSDAQDAMIGMDGKYLPGSEIDLPAKIEDQPPIARMYYVAYFKKDTPQGTRPITFIYNGGPGSSTMYLHMGAFGPMRVVLPNVQHQEAAPYSIVSNQYSLLDVSDLVFIDAPGTGFSRVLGKDAGKAFFGTDQDGHAFTRFIHRFLTKYELWNNPKFLFGESYGTTRTAVLTFDLQRSGIDVNGSVFLSQILNFDDSLDGPQGNPGTDNGYFLGFPSMAATAWYHHHVPNQPAQLEPFLQEVEQFSLGAYASALLQGADLPDEQKHAIAAKMESYTGVPAAYWYKADLRVSGGEFSKELQNELNITTGRLDTRYEGPDLDPLSEDAEYDPFGSATSAPYDAAVNYYTREVLHYGDNMTYKPSAYGPDFHWDLKHTPPGGRGWDASVNVMPDLSVAMKMNPKLKILLMGGYYDLGTTFFGATYEDKHLQIPEKLQANISYHFFQTGHMVYVTVPALKELHQVTADFIRANEHPEQ